MFFACGTGHCASSAATTSADDAMVARVKKLWGDLYHVRAAAFFSRRAAARPPGLLGMSIQRERAAAREHELTSRLFGTKEAYEAETPDTHLQGLDNSMVRRRR